MEKRHLPFRRLEDLITDRIEIDTVFGKLYAEINGDFNYPGIVVCLEQYDKDGKFDRQLALLECTPDMPVEGGHSLRLLIWSSPAEDYTDSCTFVEATPDKGCSEREAELFYGEGCRFGIYQISNVIDHARNLRFTSMCELEALGLTVDSANYELVYTAPVFDRIEFLTDRYPVLNKIHKQFNVDHPVDFKGHSLSVSDVIVLKYNGGFSAHFVDSTGFIELNEFYKRKGE